MERLLMLVVASQARIKLTIEVSGVEVGVRVVDSGLMVLEWGLVEDSLDARSANDRHIMAEMVLIHFVVMLMNDRSVSSKIVTVAADVMRL